MAFSRSQKRYIKHNIRNVPIEKIASELRVSTEDVKTYLLELWGHEKLEKVLNLKPQNFSAIPVRLPFTLPSSFSSKGFIFSSLFFLTILVIVSYANSLNNAFVSDDNGILQNRGIGDLKAVFSTPQASLRPFLYYLAYHVGGYTPIFYRLINIFFHLGSTWMVFLVLFFMANPLLALLTATIFAVHPILTEAVTWISGGTFSQYTFFFLMSLYLYEISRTRWSTYVLSLIMYFLAIISSVSSVVLCVVFLLYEYLFGNLKKNWLKIIPFFLLNGIFGFIHILNIAPRLETFRTGYYQDEATYNPIFQIPIALTSYVELIFWPDGLTLYHTELFYTVINFAVRVILFLIYLGSLVYFFKKNKLIFFWLSFYFISLLPTLTPFRVAWIVAERYVYAGAIGIFFVVAYVFYKFYQIRPVRYLAMTVFSIIIVGLTARTIIRNTDWKNEDNLWFATARTSPSSYVNHNNLGDVYARRGDFEKSLKEFTRAIEMNPKYADAYNNRANIYGRTGRIQEAITNYNRALELNPNIWQSHENLGAIYFDLKQYELAEQHMRLAIKIYPVQEALLTNLAIILATKGDPNQAKQYVVEALKINPKYPPAINLLNALQTTAPQPRK